ncbi:MAG: hypothetical protein WCG96_08090, partial [Actinomycetes bacterium]
MIATLRRYLRSGMVLSALVATSTVVISSTPAGAADLPVWNPETLPLLATQPGQGPTKPMVATDVVDGSLGLATSLQPQLTWRNVPSGVGQVRFEIHTLASRNPALVWSGSVAANGGTAQLKVAAGNLSQGRTYRWKAYSVANPTITTPSYVFNVDVQRAKSQGLFSAGPVSVAEASGEPVSIFKSSGVATKEGTASFSLVYRPSNAAHVGVPAGWQLDPGASTSKWVGLAVNADASVTLRSQTGEALTFVPADAAGDSYKPDFGENQSWPGGTVTTLVPQKLDGSSVQFTATEENRMVTVFTPTSDGTSSAEPAQIFQDGSLVLQQRWSENRLQALVDPTTGTDAYTFRYAGDPSCPSIAGIDGAIAPPAGMVCAAQDWAGQTTGVYYVQTSAGPQIGRIVQGVGAIENAGVSDYQWDGSGRLVGVRTPEISAAVAAGSVSGLGNQDPRALFQLAYDLDGRVASVTPPAGLVPGSSETADQQARVPMRITYVPTFNATVNGRTVASAAINPATMLTEWSSAGAGSKLSMTWDTPSGNLIQEQELATGSVTKTLYDSSGRPVEQDGPTTGSLGCSTTPVTRIAYAQDANGNPWTGLATLYWDNPSFVGTPSTGSVGPILDGSGRPPASLSFDLPNPPVGLTPSPQGWSARMSGSYIATTKGAYTFTNQTAQAKVWIKGLPCFQSCTVNLEAGARARIRVDVASTPSSPSIRLLVATPTAGAVAVPTSALRPDLGYATSETTFDSLSASSPGAVAGTQKLEVKMTVDPTTGRVIQEQSPAGTTTSTAYNADGSASSSTNAAGETVTASYYGANESVAVGCATGLNVPQRGLVKSAARPGFATSTQIHGASGATAAAQQGAASSCSTTIDNALGSTSGVAGVGGAVVTHSNNASGNDPLRSFSATITSSQVKTLTRTSDLLGRPASEVDEWGTTTTYAYDPATGNLTTLTQVTAKGTQRVETYRYDVDGQVTQVSVDGKVLEDATYDRTSGLLVGARLANGVQVTYRYGANLQVASISYSFPNGAVASDAGTYSVGGRLLCHATTAPDGSATSCYGADLNGKIVTGTESGSLPTLASAWTANYPGARGANADRAQVVAKLTPSGQQRYSTTSSTHVVGESFAEGDAMTALSVEGVPKAIVSDAVGRVTQRGRTTITYDASGQVLSTSKAGATVSYGYGPSGQDEQTYTPAAPAPVQALRATDGDSSTTTSSASSTTSTSIPSTTTTLSPSTSTPKQVTTTTPSSSTTVAPTTTSAPKAVTTTVPTTTTPTTARPKVAPKVATPAPITVRSSGADLLLDDKGVLVGQVIDLTSGPTVGLDASGAAQRWSYPGVDGSTAWRSTGTAPSATATYDPWGTWNSAAAPATPHDAVSLIMDEYGWGSGQGGATSPVDPSMVQLGARTYDALSGRFLQPDPQIE